MCLPADYELELDIEKKAEKFVTVVIVVNGENNELAVLVERCYFYMG